MVNVQTRQMSAPVRPVRSVKGLVIADARRKSKLGHTYDDLITLDLRVLNIWNIRYQVNALESFDLEHWLC